MGIVNTNDRCHIVHSKAWVPTECLLRAHSFGDKGNL